MSGSQNILRELINISKGDLVSFGYEKITVTDQISYLNVPDSCSYCIIVLTSTSVGPSARILQNRKIQVSSTVGIPIYNGFVMDIININNLNNFQIIKDQPGETYIYVEYFK